MGLFERIAKIISSPEEKTLQQEVQQIYCQNCGGNLTENGGDISHSGRIYCNEKYKLKRAPCGMIAFLKSIDNYEYASMIYHDGDETQKAILEGRLIQFGELTDK